MLRINYITVVTYKTLLLLLLLLLLFKPHTNRNLIVFWVWDICQSVGKWFLCTDITFQKSKYYLGLPALPWGLLFCVNYCMVCMDLDFFVSVCFLYIMPCVTYRETSEFCWLHVRRDLPIVSVLLHVVHRGVNHWQGDKWHKGNLNKEMKKKKKKNCNFLIGKLGSNNKWTQDTPSSHRIINL